MGQPPQLQFVSVPFFIAADKDRRKFLIFGGPWCAQLHSRQWSAKLEFSVRHSETHWRTRGSVELHKFRHMEEKYPEPLHRNSSGLFTNRCETVVQAIFFNLDSFMPMESSISSAAKCITPVSYTHLAEGRSAAAAVARYLTGYTNLVRSIG